ncbi:CPBP family intramembrane glutamic endopeptidase [Butyrivibrio sp. M55]|uniref:CPBP family intramembrane glutamic endopeptidase n=1 Tax=Butyrivibrio sp. M55 TaxID=1855323 RepID=UPI001587E1BE|nr:CPBP family intramembrane glutamic endopeptidase [Butyrivibrio sp. M55]
MLGFLLFGDKNTKIPKAGFIVALISALVMMALSIVSVFAPQDDAWSVSKFFVYGQYVTMVGSVICYVLFWICGKEKRKNVGLDRPAIKMSIFMVALFIFLFVARSFSLVAIAQILTNDGVNYISEFAKKLFTPENGYSAVVMLFYIFTFLLMYWGEEYGWRYYLQPILQNKFGLRRGVLILGVAWGIWHLGLDFMFYTSVEAGPIYMILQIITCISLGIFFGYAYMKTRNIWALSLIHLINDNYLVLLAGGDTSVLQNQQITLLQLPVNLIASLIFAAFIFAPIYNGKKEEQKFEQEAA